MTVTFRYDTQTISAANAERVLGHYIDGWRQWLAATADRSGNPVGPSDVGPKEG